MFESTHFGHFTCFDIYFLNHRPTAFKHKSVQSPSRVIERHILKSERIIVVFCPFAYIFPLARIHIVRDKISRCGRTSCTVKIGTGIINPVYCRPGINTFFVAERQQEFGLCGRIDKKFPEAVLFVVIEILVAKEKSVNLTMGQFARFSAAKQLSY